MGKITSAQLYQQLLDRWLKGEVKRRAVTGGVLVLAEQHLWDAVTSLALRIWQSGQWLVALLPLPEEGWAAVLPDGRYKLVGDPAGRFWHVANLCRFEPGELAPYVESCRPLPLDAVIL